jgi:toxin secretion/phage lysis holin
MTCSVAQDHITLKTVGATLYIIGSFLFGDLSQNALLALLILIILDFTVGVWEARKGGTEITARKIKNTPIKILAYYIMIVSGHLVEYGLPESMRYIDDTILAFLLLTELISIMKHFSNLGYKTPNNLINNLKKIQEEK